MSRHSGKRREAQRQKLNSTLENYGLRKFNRVGSHRKGEFEPTGEVIHVATHSNPYFVVPTIEVKRPGTDIEIGNYSYIDYPDSEDKFGVVIVPVVNHEFFVMISQHRLVIEGILPTEWPTEFPRGWIRNEQEDLFSLLYTEVPALQTMTITNLIGLRHSSGTNRNLAEDSSTRRTFARVFLVALKSEISHIDELSDFMRQEQKQASGLSSRFVPSAFSRQEVNSLHLSGGLDDFHSIVAWSFAKEWTKDW